MKPSQNKAALSFALALTMGIFATSSNAKLYVQETTNEVQAYGYYKYDLANKYRAKTNDQIILPIDIADIPVVEGSVIQESNKLPNLYSAHNEVLSNYLRQNKQAGELFNKYQKRLAVTSQGKVPKSMTLEKALNEEALYKFLDLQVTPTTISPELLDYLQARGLNQNELSALTTWGQRNASSPEIQLTIAGAIATELNNSYNGKELVSK